jgi:superfamily II DNA helicase RecQ
MQIKIFTIPLMGGERVNEEMNVFLRSRRILNVESKLMKVGESDCWSFCVRYQEEDRTSAPSFSDKEKPDYEKLLDKDCYERFNHMKKIRRDLCKAEGIPAYTIFTDEQLAGLAKIEKLSLSKMKTVKGIGDKTIEKYGERFLKNFFFEKKTTFQSILLN